MNGGSFIAAPISSTNADDGSTLQINEAVLWAGDIVVSRTPTRMSTVLGSCVSVCLYDKQRRFGGMNHYLVPTGGTKALHGDWSMVELIRRMQQLGSTVESLEAKLFGGGCPLRLTDETYAVGPGNVAMARQVLAEHGIPVRVERTGHEGGVKLYFENWTGVVWFKANTQQKAA